MKTVAESLTSTMQQLNNSNNNNNNTNNKSNNQQSNPHIEQRLDNIENCLKDIINRLNSSK